MDDISPAGIFKSNASLWISAMQNDAATYHAASYAIESFAISLEEQPLSNV